MPSFFLTSVHLIPILDSILISFIALLLLPSHCLLASHLFYYFSYLLMHVSTTFLLLILLFFIGQFSCQKHTINPHTLSTSVAYYPIIPLLEHHRVSAFLSPHIFSSFLHFPPTVLYLFIVLHSSPHKNSSPPLFIHYKILWSSPDKKLFFPFVHPL